MNNSEERRFLMRLFLVSFAALFVEIILIRWIGTEVRIFAYFQNLALIACFLGIMLAGAYSIPLFFAGVIFTETFRNAANKSSAFGANIVGAVAGSIAQNLSFIFGMKALLIVALLFYLGAAWCASRGRERIACT